ncbi:MAG TPA: Rv2993c-like domain-containing protein, partial [Capsulimonadaceae bacterium]|nr:Rv2993c-like domain-containing protein [Capsulimonadaceae bacterium]
MKIVRYQDKHNNVSYGALQSDGTVRRIEGDIFGAYNVTGETALEAKRLAPLSPCTILAIGLNYREHAKESGAKIPEYPILFFKGLNSV